MQYAVRQRVEKHRENRKDCIMVCNVHRPRKGIRWSTSSRSLYIWEKGVPEKCVGIVPDTIAYRICTKEREPG